MEVNICGIERAMVGSVTRVRDAYWYVTTYVIGNIKMECKQDYAKTNSSEKVMQLFDMRNDICIY